MIKVNFINDTVSVIDEDIQLTPLVEEEVSRISVKVHKANVGSELPTDDIYVFSSDMDNVSRIYKGVNNAPRQLYPTPVAVPELTGTYTYTGSAQTVTISPYDTTKIAVSGDTTATNAGTYTVTFTLINSEDIWVDGTKTAKTAMWSIDKAEATLSFNQSSGYYALENIGSVLIANVYMYTMGNNILSVTSSDPEVILINNLNIYGTSAGFSTQLISSGTATITVIVDGTENIYAKEFVYSYVIESGYKYLLCDSNFPDSSSSVYDSYMFGLSIGDYAIFGGSPYNDGKMYSYNDSFTRSQITSLSTPRKSGADATIGNYALAAGGAYNTTYYKTVETYNKSLTHSTAADMNTAKSWHKGDSVGNYAIFAGGAMTEGSYTYKDVDAYNTSLTHSKPTDLPYYADRGMGSAHVGNYAMFAGGSFTNYLAIYNTSLTLTTSTVAGGVNDCSGSQTTNHALMVVARTKTINVIDSSLTQTTISMADTASYNACPFGNIGIDGCALFPTDGISIDDSLVQSKIIKATTNEAAKTESYPLFLNYSKVFSYKNIA